MLLLYAAALWYTVRTTPRTSGPSDTGRKPRRLWFIYGPDDRCRPGAR